MDVAIKYCDVYKTHLKWWTQYAIEMERTSYYTNVLNRSKKKVSLLSKYN